MKFPYILNHIFTPTWAEEANTRSLICTIGRFLALPSNSVMTSIMHHTVKIIAKIQKKCKSATLTSYAKAYKVFHLY